MNQFKRFLYGGLPVTNIMACFTTCAIIILAQVILFSPMPLLHSVTVVFVCFLWVGGVNIISKSYYFMWLGCRPDEMSILLWPIKIYLSQNKP